LTQERRLDTGESSDARERRVNVEELLANIGDLRPQP